MVSNKFRKIAEERNNPCVTISLNTHRTHPDSLQDEVLLKKLLREAEERVISKYGKKSVAPLLKRIDVVANKINRNYNLDSLHLFLSNDTEEIVKLPISTLENVVQVADRFNIRTLIKAYNRRDEYLIMLLSQGGVSLYHAVNDKITEEIQNEGFPFATNPHIVTDREKRSDAELMDDMVREYYNKVDKALVKIYNETGFPCVVVCTELNFSRLMEVTDKPEIYLDFEPVNYNDISVHNLGKQGWKTIQEYQDLICTMAIEEMEQAIPQGKVLTDLQEIYQAAIDGRGELLISREDFEQPVSMTGERTFEIVSDKNADAIIDDITGIIAWEVLSKNGRTFFTMQEQLKKIGDIALKVRY
jgi:hypothetical protein